MGILNKHTHTHSLQETNIIWLRRFTYDQNMWIRRIERCKRFKTKSYEGPNQAGFIPCRKLFSGSESTVQGTSETCSHQENRRKPLWDRNSWPSYDSVFYIHPMIKKSSSFWKHHATTEIRARCAEPQLPVFRFFSSVWIGSTWILVVDTKHSNIPVVDLRARVLCAKEVEAGCGKENAQNEPKVRCSETNAASWNKWKLFWLLAQVKRRLSGGSTESPVSSEKQDSPRNAFLRFLLATWANPSSTRRCLGRVGARR